MSVCCDGFTHHFRAQRVPTTQLTVLEGRHQCTPGGAACLCVGLGGVSRWRVNAQMVL